MIRSRKYSNLIVGCGLAMAMGMGCHSNDKPQAPGHAGQQPQKVNPSCQKSGLFASPTASQAISGYFMKASSRLDSMSAYTKSKFLFDTDRKGRVITRAQSDAPVTPDLWSQKDPETDKVPGTATERAYKELDAGQGETITVAIIDTGIEFSHEDLKDRQWVNQAEAQGAAGKDNDGDGYAGDVNGWNYLVNKDGQDVNYTTLEVTREKIRLDQEIKAGTLKDDDKYNQYIQALYAKMSKEDQDTIDTFTAAQAKLKTALDTLVKECLIAPYDDNTSGDQLLKNVNAVVTTDDAAKSAVDFAKKLLPKWTPKRLADTAAERTKEHDANYSLTPDPSNVVADKGADVQEVGTYGNANVAPADTESEQHATHVAGIIGADRDNNLGMNGQATNVKFISLRTVPNGDERDKDVANAIMYAADHGARVINMSFGKAVSPHRDWVWNAIRHANEKGVLLVQAAGNSSEDIDDLANNPNFPTPVVTDADGKPTGEVLENMIEVGASTKDAKALAASFSNYGQKNVDLFAPGQEIYSTIPGNSYANFDGTSMAAPQVTGIAALVLSKYPKLTVKQLKDVLLGNVTDYSQLSVPMPTVSDGTPAMIAFGKLSAKGGVINAYTALKAAAAISQ